MSTRRCVTCCNVHTRGFSHTVHCPVRHPPPKKSPVCSDWSDLTGMKTRHPPHFCIISLASQYIFQQHAPDKSFTIKVL